MRHRCDCCGRFAKFNIRTQSVICSSCGESAIGIGTPAVVNTHTPPVDEDIVLGHEFVNAGRNRLVIRVSNETLMNLGPFDTESIRLFLRREHSHRRILGFQMRNDIESNTSEIEIDFDPEREDSYTFYVSSLDFPRRDHLTIENVGMLLPIRYRSRRIHRVMTDIWDETSYRVTAIFHPEPTQYDQINPLVPLGQRGVVPEFLTQELIGAFQYE